MKLIYSKRFSKRFKKCPHKIRSEFSNRLKLFLIDPKHPLLRNRALSGDLLGRYAFSISGDCRVLYRLIDRTTLKFLDIGTHNQVYD